MLKPEVINSLKLSNSLGVITDQVFEEILRISFSHLTTNAETTSISKICSSKPDVIKEIHSSLLKASAEFARHDIKKEHVRQFLTSDCGFGENRAELYAEHYDKNKVKLQILLGNIGVHLPHIVDVKWKIDYIVKMSNLDQSEGPIFRVILFTESYDIEKLTKKIEEINFSCNSEELQDLVYKLKDVLRYTQRLNVER